MLSGRLKKKQQLSGDPARRALSKTEKVEANKRNPYQEQTTTHTHTKGYLEESQQLLPTVCLPGRV